MNFSFNALYWRHSLHYDVNELSHPRLISLGVKICAAVEINAHLDGDQCEFEVKMVRVLVQSRNFNFKENYKVFKREKEYFILIYLIVLMQVFQAAHA